MINIMSQLGQTVIDVTMASPQLADRVSQWGVVDSVANSDHLSIEMLLQLNKGWTNPPKVWDLRSNKFDKKGFTTMMEERSDKVIHNRFVTPQDLDAYGLSFVMDMTECLDETAPLTSKPTNIARPGWFDSECKRLLRRLRHIRRYLRNRTRLQRRRGLPDCQNRQNNTWNDYNHFVIFQS